MKLKKLITMGLAAIMAVSAMGISAFADDSLVTDTVDGSTTEERVIFDNTEEFELYFKVDENGEVSPLSTSQNTYGITCYHTNSDGSNGTICGNGFVIYDSTYKHNTVSATITGISGIKTANLALWYANGVGDGNSLTALSPVGDPDSYQMLCEKGEGFTYTATGNALNSAVVVKCSTYDVPDNGSYGTIAVKIVTSKK